MIHLTSGAFGQTYDKNIDTFYSLFSEVDFETLTVYTHGRVPAKYPKTSLYPFKGQKVNPSLHYLLGSEKNTDSFSELFATYRFYINPTLEALLIREYTVPEHRMYCLVYDNQHKKVLKEIELAYNYGYEGSFGGKQSSFLDINKDGFVDILTRFWEQHVYSSINSDSIYFEEVDSLYFQIWSKGKFEKVLIKDEKIVHNLKNSFQFYHPSQLPYQDEKLLVDVGIIEKKESQHNHWAIIAGSDSDLEKAKYEVERMVRFKSDYYRLRSCYPEIHKKTERYYTIITCFENKNDAEIALKKVKMYFNKTAYLVGYKKWCSQKEYQKGYYYECVE